MPSDAPRSKKLTREEIRATIAPKYSWKLHIFLLVILSCAGVVLSVTQLHSVELWQWGAFVGMLIFMNAGEYAIHRGPFHVPMGSKMLYRRHTTMHHTYFTHDRMAAEEMRDLRLVMFPPIGFLGICASLSPFFLILYFYAPKNLAWLFALGVLSYYIVYEITHALSHLPNDIPLAGNRVIRAVCNHHRLHHDLKLMRKYNFNFALPLFDLILGTLYTGEKETGANETGRANPTTAAQIDAADGVK